MEQANPSAFKEKKNCLLVFRNKKLNIFDGPEQVISSFASIGYYFDKISYIAYDRAEEIVNALRDGKDNYENIVLFCPSSMDTTLKTFINALYSAEFDAKGVLSVDTDTVFMLYSDADNALSYGEIRQILDQKYGVRYEKNYIRLIGVSAYKVNTVISQAKQTCPELNFNVFNSYGDTRIEIVYSSSLSKITFDSVMRQMITEFKDNVYALEDISLAERLFQVLKLRRIKISVAESFTGGGIGQKLVEIPGVSDVYFEGLNTYSNESKVSRLGVDEFTLNMYGAVSEQTAYQMAEGLLKTGNCDMAISTTGIAGPASDNTSKPVGLVYIGIALVQDISVYEYNLKGDRENITKTAINLALFHAFKTLK